MQLRSALLVFLAGLGLGGCVTTETAAPRQFPAPTDYVPLDAIRIDKTFDRVPVDAVNLGTEARRCVPTLPPESQNVKQTAGKLPLPRGTTLALMHLSSSSAFIIIGSNAICVHQSANHYPIFAVEAFESTVNPAGVPPGTTDQWYEQIARRLAEQGRVSVAYVFANGNANVANYWVTAPNVYALQFSSEFKKAGSWESGTYDFRFSSPLLTSVSITKRGNATQKVDLIDRR